MNPRPEDVRHAGNSEVGLPPQADLVDGCPPHHWVIVAGWQSCKKCGVEQEVPTAVDTGNTFWRKSKAAKSEDADH